MPDRDATTIGDLIYYQYAKIIAKSAFGVHDGARGQGKALRVREADVRGIGKGSQELWGDRRRGTLKVHFEPTSPSWVFLPLPKLSRAVPIAVPRRCK